MMGFWIMVVIEELRDDNGFYVYFGKLESFLMYWLCGVRESKY